MFEMNLQNVIIIVLVIIIAYVVYKKMEGFADEKHHHHHSKHHHGRHQGKHHGEKWHRIPQMVFPGYDMYYQPANSVEACEKICAEEPLCTHSTFDGQNTCYVSSPNGANQGWNIAGFKRSDGTYARYPNNDLAGFDLPGSGNPEPSLEACESACNNTNNCVNYTYDRNQSCFIKGPEPSNMPGLILSLKP